MLGTFALVLVVLWLLGFVVFHVTSFLIHLLLLVALIVLVYNWSQVGDTGDSLAPLHSLSTSP